MDSLNASETRQLEERLQRKQAKDMMNVYSGIVQRCFTDCVNDFTSKSLQGHEEGCVMRCVDKFMKSQERLTQRFQEQNAAMAQQSGGGMLS